MWNDYVGKTVLVRELDEDRGFGDRPIALMVLKTQQVNVREMALVVTTRGDIYWEYCSRYEVILIEESSSPSAEWFPHLGKNLLVDDGSGIIVEVIPVQARGNYCLGKFKWLGNDNMDSRCRWFNVADYTIISGGI